MVEPSFSLISVEMICNSFKSSHSMYLLSIWQWNVNYSWFYSCFPAIDYTLDTEYYKTQSNLPPRMQFVEKGVVLGTKIKRNTILQSKLQQCFEIQAHIQVNWICKTYTWSILFMKSFWYLTQNHSWKTCGIW